MPSTVRRRFAAAVVCWWLAVPCVPDAQIAQPAGRIKAASGFTSILRGGRALPADAGAEVHPDDLLRTGADGQLAVMLKDESRLAIGPNSELALRTFTYEPAEGRLSLILRLTRGVLSYISGRIAKLMPEAVELQTPTSVIGVRGTHALVQVTTP